MVLSSDISAPRVGIFECVGLLIEFFGIILQKPSPELDKKRGILISGTLVQIRLTAQAPHKSQRSTGLSVSAEKHPQALVTDKCLSQVQIPSTASPDYTWPMVMDQGSSNRQDRVGRLRLFQYTLLVPDRG